MARWQRYGVANQSIGIPDFGTLVSCSATLCHTIEDTE
jgi:hypothetical protein